MIIADSDLIIDFLKDDQKAIKTVVNLRKKELITTVINAQEVLIGPILAENAKKFSAAHDLMRQFHVLNYDWRSMSKKLRIHHYLKKQGTPIGEKDEMIAGICLANKATLITRNTKHFEKVPGLKVKSW